MTAVDHFFVFVGVGAPEQERLRAHGLEVGVRRRHDGQGTANVCFGFADCYLELIWIDDPVAAVDGPSAPLGLHRRMRWRELAASPFGICVRDELSPEGTPRPTPFPSWQLTPPYLPPGMSIDIGSNHDRIAEPLLFRLNRPLVPFDVDHELSRLPLRRLVVTTPALSPDSMLRRVHVDRLELRDGGKHLMEIELGDGREPEHELDLRPHLPLVIRH